MRNLEYATFNCISCDVECKMCTSGMPLTKECTKCRKKRWKLENLEPKKDSKHCSVCSVKIGKNNKTGFCRLCYRTNRKDVARVYNNEYSKQRYNSDIDFRLMKCLRSRLSHAIREHAIEKKNVSAIGHLGCSMSELKIYLEARFQVGMTWGNYGEWEIDHIIPLSKNKALNTSLEELCHYSNLQPLWELDNLRKLNKLTINLSYNRLNNEKVG